MYVFFVLGENKIFDMTAKGCAMSEECVDGSINFGIVRTVHMTSCCTTPLCNNRFQDYKSIPNGKKCFSCKGEDCTRTVNCEGEENHCIKMTANAAGVRVELKGCASKLMCTDQVTSLLTMYSGLQYSCCQGDYCNSASSASPALLLLLVPLFFSALFC
ncbi:urokinase plasminogen activator surface receptor-like [Cyprinodon tularosa]|uniref:urokinase plasminogen activator surface receptor-like n=1 Tax=Cyprinodon tularosa TaxID=77115 RepID=UPI0018E2385B|nr:urokinase plasminogen activator surface receptor-like [Cyprinodon tularosa]